MQASIGEIIEKLDQAEKIEKRASVAMYETHDEAEAAVRMLERGGFDMTKLSIVGKDYQLEEGVVGYYTSGDRMKAWGKSGAFWGGILGLFTGSALFVIPGIGPILAAGPIVALIVGALEGAVVVGGLSAFGAGLYSLGIPEDAIIEYETQIKAGKFAVIANGTLDEVSKIEAALAT
jgi:Heat induced stress protein YflT